MITGLRGRYRAVGVFILCITLAFLGVFAYGRRTDGVRVDGLGVEATNPGTLPARWASGLDCANASPFQVHAYGEDFYIIRQSMCANYEAPFLFLFIGAERALLMDTEAVPDANVYGAVMDILEQRADELDSDPVPLVVAHTHSHGDHRSADAEFREAVGVETLVGLSVDEVMEFGDFTDWPNDTGTFDLGNRVFDVLVIPGHHTTSIALYDRRTGVLLTGDSVYPGHLFIPSAEAWPVVRDLREAGRVRGG